jgi:integrase
MKSLAPSPLLGTPQLAFVRAWAEGIDPVIAWERFLYLDGAGDARTARRELARLREQLRRVARLNGRPDIAALLCRDPEAMVERDSARPSLDEFRQGIEEDFYSEAELLQLYEEAHGKPDSRSSARRRQRLRERLLLALQWLQEKAARPPLREDAVTLWLDERIARRLAQAGIRTLGELQFWVRSHGYHWHRQIPRLGAVGALRIVRWLQEHEATLGALPSSSVKRQGGFATQALEPQVQVAIVPIERLAAPTDERSGRQGANRAAPHRCKLQAREDLAAVQAWLAAQQPDSNTWRAYRREGERFLLWSLFERRKALSSLDGDDCAAYREFLAAPGPQWVGRRHTPRWSEAWRPMEGPLGAASRRTAEAIVRSLCEWLRRQHYLESNPWEDVERRPAAPSSAAERVLAPPEWDLLLAWLDDLKPSAAQARLRFLLHFAVHSGLRLSQLAAARVSWFAVAGSSVQEPAWTILTPGIPGRVQALPLPIETLRLWSAYAQFRGLQPDPRHNPPETPVLSHLRAEQALSPTRIHDILADAFERCSLASYPGKHAAADRIRRASTEWLRRTGVSALARGGTVPPRILRIDPA